MGVLSGVRIVEFEALGPVPLCAMLLADHGADIIRIARPGASAVDHLTGAAILHRGRSTVTLDLKRPEDQEAALALVAQADALMEGFRPGVMERLGLGPETCFAANPRLVYGRMTGWGQDGPLAQRAGHDINYIALTGALSAIGPADGPVPPLNLVGDYGGGTMFLAFGVLAGLLEARQTGRGRVVDAAMCDAVPVLLSLFHAFQHAGQWSDRRADNLLDGGAPFYRTYRCRDGRFIAIGALEPQFFAAMMRGLGLDPDAWRQDDKPSWPAMAEAIAARVATRDRDDWATHFAAVDACVSPVLDFGEAPSSAHMAARGVFRSRDGLVEAAPAPRFGDPGEATPRVEPPAPAVQASISVEEVLARWRR